MRPKRLIMRGFITYKDKVDIDFSKLYDKKIFLVSGDTGSGKTSIFDAISFALYGKVARNITSDRLRCDFLSEDDPYTFVSLEFEVKDKTYLIERIPRQVAKKTKKAQNIGNSVSFFEIIDGEKKFISDKQGETDLAVKKIIGLDDKQFSKVMLLAQGQFQEFLSAKSSDKAALLGDIFKTYEYKDIQDRLKESSRDYLTKMDYIDRELYNTIDYSDEVKRLVDKDNILTHEFDLIMEDIGQGKKKLDDNYEKILSSEENLDNSLKELYQSLEETRTFNEGVKKYKNLEKELNLYINEEDKNKKLLREIRKGELAQNILVYEKRYKQAVLDKNNLLESLEQDKISKSKEKNRLADLEKSYNNLDTDKKILDEVKISYENTKKTLIELEAFESYKNSYQSLDTDRKTLEGLLKNKENLEDKQKNNRKIFDLANEMLREISEKGTLVSKNLEILLENTRKLEDDYKKISEIDEFNKEINNLEEDKKKEEDIEKKALENDELNTINKMIDKLNEDKVCPVCKTVHKNPLGKYDVDSYDLGEIRKKLANINQALALRKSQIEKIRKEISSEEKLADIKILLDKNYANKKDLEEKLIDLREKYKSKAKDIKSYKKIIEETNIEIEENTLKIKNIEEKLEDSKENEIKYLSLKDKMEGLNKDDLEYSKQKLKEKIDKLSKNIDSITKSYQDLELKLRELDSNIKNKKLSIKDLDQKSELYLKEFEEILYKNFEDRKTYEILLISYEENKEEKDGLEEFFRKMDRLKTSLENYASYKNEDEKDLLLVNKKIEEKANDKAILSDKKAEVFSEITIFTKVLGKITNLKDEYDRSLKSAETLAKLSKLADGSFGKVSGREKIDFETFVLTFYFDKVLRLANIRLLDMTDNQFSMVRNSDATDLRSKAGLDIEILDANTGKLRPVATLSGGESFLASLSLALGLSDEISMENGGIKIDTLFIDEGFGTLSKDYLTNAITAIEKLAYEDKFIGLISHVDELKEAIDSKIKVTYEPNLGSYVEVISW